MTTDRPQRLFPGAGILVRGLRMGLVDVQTEIAWLDCRLLRIGT